MTTTSTVTAHRLPPSALDARGEEGGVPLSGVGETTQSRRRRTLEPDECYFVSRLLPAHLAPLATFIDLDHQTDAVRARRAAPRW
jgi:hypothetical protein